MLRVLAILLVLSLVVAGPAMAQDGGGFQKKDGDEKKEGDQKKDGDDEKEKKAEPTALEKLVKELRSMVAREKAKPDFDRDLVAALESLVIRFEKQVRKEKAAEKKKAEISLDDLSEADRKKLEDEMRKKIAEEWRNRGGGAPGAGGGAGDWTQRAVDTVLEDIDLKDEQREEVTGILGDYYKDAFAARGDTKLLKDIRNDTERRLKKVVGGSKAKKIMNNINKAAGGRRGWGR